MVALGCPQTHPQALALVLTRPPCRQASRKRLEPSAVPLPFFRLMESNLPAPVRLPVQDHNDRRKVACTGLPAGGARGITLNFTQQTARAGEVSVYVDSAVCVLYEYNHHNRRR